jgi:hypothetical protein
LWAILKITRVDYRKEEGASWDLLYRWAPKAVMKGVLLSQPEGLSALIGKYLEAVIAADQDEIERFFSNLVPRQRIREALHALQAARELSFLSVGARTLIRLTPVVDEPRIMNTRVTNTRVVNTRVANTRVANTRVTNTRIANTRIANKRHGTSNNRPEDNSPSGKNPLNKRPLDKGTRIRG